MKSLSISSFLLGVLCVFNSCSTTEKKKEKVVEEETKAIEQTEMTYASSIIPFSDDWNLILGDGSNAGHPNNFEHKDFFYTANDEDGDWVVYKAPNACLLYTSPSPRDA